MRLTLLIMGLLPACVFAANCVRPGDSVFASSFDIPAQRAFYVASNGSNGADGSLATPWRTIQHGIDVAQAGDLVCVRGGIYNELVSMTRSGSLAAGPIVLQSVPGETAIIDGTGLPIPDGQYGLVTLIDVSHVSVQGLELRNYTTASTALVPIGMYVTGAGTPHPPARQPHPRHPQHRQRLRRQCLRYQGGWHARAAIEQRPHHRRQRHP